MPPAMIRRALLFFYDPVNVSVEIVAQFRWNQVNAVFSREYNVDEYLDERLRHILFVAFSDGGYFTR